MRSLSEIDTISKRASRAVGFSWGIAEEIGKSIRLLELFGLPGIQTLNKYYSVKSKKKFENLNLIEKNNSSNKHSYCPINLGISFLDQIRNLERFEKITFNKISFPLLALPFLSKSSEVIGKRIKVNFNNYEFLLNLNVNISSNLSKKKIPEICENIEICIIENEDNFSEQEWKSLYKLSEETFVEETDSLKQRAAGAGLTDND